MFVYIIFYTQLGKFYIGFTHEEVELRLQKHQLGIYDKSFSKVATDWILKLSIPCSSISQALKIEKHIKRMKSSVYINNLIQYPEMVDKLLARYKDS